MYFFRLIAGVLLTAAVSFGAQAQCSLANPSACGSPGINNLAVGGYVNAFQIGTYTNTQMNTPYTFLLNGINIATEFAATQGGTNHATQSLVSGVSISSGSTVAMGGPLAVYGNNYSTSTNLVGIFDNVRALANGVEIFGRNTSLTDSNFNATVVGEEMDIECANAGTACIGMNFEGVFPNQTPTNQGIGVQVAAISTYPWSTAFQSATGAAVIGLALNPATNGANADGQSIRLYSKDGTSTLHLCAIQNLHGASSAQLNLTCQTTGDTISFSSELVMNANLALNGSTFYNGGTAIAFPASGILAGTTDTQTLTNKSISANEINSGTLTLVNTPQFASSATGVGTQTFVNSPCTTSLTNEQWVPVTITGQSGTWYFPTCH